MATKSKLRALIVDDEPPARKIIRRILEEEHPDVEVVGECGNGRDAIDALAELTVDLLFLDIEMPEMNGFEMLENVSGEDLPSVIFVTAYDRYAVRAFEVAAVDYLLKPFCHDRLAMALERVRSCSKESDTRDRTRKILDLLVQMKAKSQYLDRFVIKKNGHVILVPAADVQWIEAEGNYLRLQTSGASHLVRDTMNKLEQKLDPQRFVRIHRSTIVNIDHIRELQVHFNEEHLVILKDGRQLTLSRRFRERVSKVFGTSI